MGESIAEKPKIAAGTNTPPSEAGDIGLRVLYSDHARSWKENTYVYAVVSRRSGGLSIGINLNPDRACNFDCIYCEVDRKLPVKTRKVDLEVLGAELEELIRLATSGELYHQPPFDGTPPDKRRICDIAFSGDGEPTTCPVFADAVRVAAAARLMHGLMDTKLVLITDACYLARDAVKTGLRILDANNGEIWAKLDAGTQAYYELVNRPNYPLSHVVANIIDAARDRPVLIQSLWMRVHAAPPPITEVDAYCDRLRDIVAAGGNIKLVQLYTIARSTTEVYATPLLDAELDAIAARVADQTQLPTATYYGV